MKLNLTAMWSTGVLALAIFMFGCQEMDSLDSNLLDKSELALSDGAGDNINARMMIQNVEPVFWNQGDGGNATCADVAGVFDLDGFNSSSQRVNTSDGAFTGTFPAGFTVTLEEDGKSLKWSFAPDADQCLFDIVVIVKGGPAANLYYYENGQMGGTGLVAPNGAGISNVTLCYNITTAPAAPEVMGDEACYETGITLTAKAKNVAEGVTIVWYETAEGGEPVSPSISTVGSKTFYAEAVSGTCTSTSRSAATLEIWALPNAPTNPNTMTKCIEDFASLTAEVDVAEGETIIWFDKDGEETDDPTLYGVGTATFYAMAVSKNGCESGKTEVNLELKECGDTEIEEDPCYADETAWASRGAGLDRYNMRGNWATWVYFDGDKTVDLFAGQTHLIGSVSFVDNGDETVTITIEMNEDGAFQNVDSNVKIQGYVNKPSGNPAIGNFEYKGNAEGSSYETTIPKSNYYGVHVDAGRLIECPVVVED